MPLSSPTLTLIVLAFALMASLMTWAWFVQRRTKDAGVVDIVWSAGFGVLAALYALGLDGWAPRKWLVAGLVAAWSWRLAIHLAARGRRDGQEDGRYAAMRKEKGDRFQGWIFGFFQLQAISVVLLSLPALLALSNPTPAFGVADIVGAVILVISIAGEAVADRQLARFRTDPANRGRVCQQGLWRYSRHPNYFFEWLHWMVYPVWTLGLPYGAATVLAPLVMLFLMLRVTGIPPTEEQAVRSRGDAYREYQRTTSAFFPWRPRSQP